MRDRDFGFGDRPSGGDRLTGHIRHPRPADPVDVAAAAAPGPRTIFECTVARLAFITHRALNSHYCRMCRQMRGPRAPRVWLEALAPQVGRVVFAAPGT